MKFTLTCEVRFDQESETYVSHCPEVNQFSAGTSENEAIVALLSALYMQANARFEHGNFDVWRKMLDLPTELIARKAGK